jgi:hypothetical protein
MIKAFIYMKTKEKKVFWKLILKTKVKGKDFQKEFEGIAESKEELSQPLEILESAIKIKTQTIEVITNYSYINKLLEKYNGELKIKSILDKEYKEDISEMENYAEKNLKDLPTYLKIRLSEIQEDNFEKNLKISMILFRAYLYFKENPEETIEIPLIADMKRENLIDKEILMEDLFISIEETFSIPS